MDAQWLSILKSFLNTSQFHPWNISLWRFCFKLEVYVKIGHFILLDYLDIFPFLIAITPNAFGGPFGKLEAINSVASV
jgi:hypothetical protein